MVSSGLVRNGWLNEVTPSTILLANLQIEWKAGREISEALLEGFLRAEEGAASAHDYSGFPFLLSLHAFAVTDVQLCMPAKDPFKFVRSLAPYLKIGHEGVGVGGAAASAAWPQLSADQQRRGAEVLLSVLSVVDDVLSQLSDAVGAATVEELVQDLADLVNKHPYVQVGGAAGWEGAGCWVESKAAAKPGAGALGVSSLVRSC